MFYLFVFVVFSHPIYLYWYNGKTMRLPPSSAFSYKAIRVLGNSSGLQEIHIGAADMNFAKQSLLSRQLLGGSHFARPFRVDQLRTVVMLGMLRSTAVDGFAETMLLHIVGARHAQPLLKWQSDVGIRKY